MISIKTFKSAAFSSAVLIALSLQTGGAQAEMSESEINERAEKIHANVVTVDTHVDVPLNYASVYVDPARFTEAQVDLPKMRAGGLDAAFFIVYTPQGDLTEQGYGEALRIAETRLAAIKRMVRAYPEQITLAESSKKVASIARSGRRVALVGMENAFPLGPSIERAEYWRDQGVRYMGITHFGHNQFGDSSNPNTAKGETEDKFGGLSDLGRELVAELNRLGVMVDVSHAGKKTMMQATALSKAPVIASHSGAMGVSNSPRNLDDEQFKALAENGGVAQMVAFDTYVKPLNEEQIAFRKDLAKELGIETREKRSKASKAVLDEYRERAQEVWEIAARATVSDFVDHIDHAVKIAGVDHVGIASDFDGGGGVVGWDDASETLNVTRELVRRGYSSADIEKIWGGNLLRVLRDVQAVSRTLNRS
ncbi:MAG: dipeptidase [Pseudomonadota bacterium]